MSDPMRLLHADDNELMRDSVATFVHRRLGKRVELVGQFSDAAEAVAQARSKQVDVVLSDLEMPERPGGLYNEHGGLLVADQLRRTCRVVIMSNSTEAKDVMAAIAAGAAGYLEKDSLSEVNARLYLEAFEGPRGQGFLMSSLVAKSLRGLAHHLPERNEHKAWMVGFVSGFETSDSSLVRRDIATLAGYEFLTASADHLVKHWPGDALSQPSSPSDHFLS